MVTSQGIGEKQHAMKGFTFFVIAISMMVFTALVAISVSAATDTTRPTIISVMPGSNVQDVPTNSQITIVFSEDMDPASINTDTITVMQRPTPEFGGYTPLAIPGTIVYFDRTAVFTPTESFSPNQRFGNVFTVKISGEVTDLTGNSLARDYVTSFTTGLDLFNTGSTTAQQDQSSTPVFASAPTPVQAPPATAPVLITAAATSAVPWAWIIGAALLLIVLGVFFLANRDSSLQEKSRTTRTSRKFGDTLPVEQLEGIGPEYTKGLHAMGIMNTKQLWQANAAKVANGTGAPRTSVEAWQHMAELASVKGIGPQYAELLVRSGIHSIEELKGYEPNQLLKLVRKKQDSLKVNIQGNSPGHAMVEHWIHEAREHGLAQAGG